MRKTNFMLDSFASQRLSLPVLLPTTPLFHHIPLRLPFKSTRDPTVDSRQSRTGICLDRFQFQIK